MSKEQQIPGHLEWFVGAVKEVETRPDAIEAIERAYFRWLDTVESASFIVDDATDPDEPIPYQLTDAQDLVSLAAKTAQEIPLVVVTDEDPDNT